MSWACLLWGGVGGWSLGGRLSFLGARTYLLGFKKYTITFLHCEKLEGVQCHDSNSRLFFPPEYMCVNMWRLTYVRICIYVYRFNESTLLSKGKLEWAAVVNFSRVHLTCTCQCYVDSSFSFPWKLQIKNGDVRLLGSTSFILFRKDWSSEVRLHGLKMLQVLPHLDPLPAFSSPSMPMYLKKCYRWNGITFNMIIW